MTTLVEKVKLGALSIDGTVLPLPERPWGYKGSFAPSKGNIPFYDGGKIELVASSDPENMISWVPVDPDKKLLIADRNLLTRISWEQLNEQDLIFGKIVGIEGRRYKLRVLTGGDTPLEDDFELGGIPKNNEWDLYITNRAEAPGLPCPSDDDFGEQVSEVSFNGSHNQFWNWAYTYSWCQESHVEFGSPRAIRGHFSARLWNYYTSSDRYAVIGWRPALEVLDSDPLNSDEDDLKNREISSRLSELVESQLEAFKGNLKAEINSILGKKG